MSNHGPYRDRHEFRCEATACSVAAVALEREKSAENQKHDGCRNDQSGALANPRRDRGEPGWEKHSCEATENGEPAQTGHEHRPAGHPHIVSAHNGNPSDTAEPTTALKEGAE